MLSYINTNAKQNDRKASLGTLFNSLQRCAEYNAAKIGSVLGLYLKKK